ncbi:hypothetical protein BJ973_008233 [Actinoplanes tereljensis]
MSQSKLASAQSHRVCKGAAQVKIWHYGVPHCHPHERAGLALAACLVIGRTPKPHDHAAAR